MFDFDNDGLLDVYVTNYGDYYLGGYANQLLHKTGVGEHGNPHFEDVAPALHMDLAGHGESDWSLGLTGGDYDNDGDLDLHMANGYIPTDLGLTTGHPNELRENLGLSGPTPYHSHEVGHVAGIDDTGDARGVVYGDLNRDGFIDFLVVNNSFVSGPETHIAPARILYVNHKNGVGEFLDREAPVDRNVVYTLEAAYRDGSRERLRSQAFRFHPVEPTVLRQNLPNPFTSATTIPLLAPRGGTVTVEVFDASGRRVRRLESTVAGGEASVAWDGTDDGGREVPSGIYFYRVRGHRGDPQDDPPAIVRVTRVPGERSA